MQKVTEVELADHSVAPRVTEKELEANIICVNFFTVGDAIAAIGSLDHAKAAPIHASHELLTICVLVLKNGFTVTGESACASPANFNAEIGQRIAFENAKQKIWPLMGYALRDMLAHGWKGWTDGDARRNGGSN